MLSNIESDTRDAVLVRNMDRLHRRPIKLGQFTQTCSCAGLINIVTLHGHLNLGNGDGLLVSRLRAAIAAIESDAKRQRKMLEIAEAGLTLMTRKTDFKHTASPEAQTWSSPSCDPNSSKEYNLHNIVLATT